MYEIVSEMNTRQDVMEDRLVAMEEKLSLMQETLESLPEALSRFLQQQHPSQIIEPTEQQRRQQYLHPETSYGINNAVISHSKSVPNTSSASGSGSISVPPSSPCALTSQCKSTKPS